MMGKVFIDGESGTTGLQIAQRLSGRSDIELLHLDTSERRDVRRRTEMLNAADVSILCLPDDAAREAVSLIENPQSRVIDASTAHRVSPGWVYGFPEHTPSRPAEIASARLVSNPGCYPTGAISMIYPLIAAGLLPADYPVTVNAVSGYSGGGKSLIAAFEDESAANYTTSKFYLYGLSLEHKHVPEMHIHSGLKHRPIFVPSVGHLYKGMIVSIPLQLWSLPGKPTATNLHEALFEYYGGDTGPQGLSVAPLAETAKLIEKLDPETMNDTDAMTLHVFANETREQAVLCAVLDNLGKGAAGQAVRNLELMLGIAADSARLRTASVGA